MSRGSHDPRFTLFAHLQPTPTAPLDDSTRRELIDAALSVVVTQLDPKKIADPDEEQKEKIRKSFENALAEIISRQRLSVSLEEQEKMQRDAMNRLLGLGFLEELLPPNMVDLEEIAINPDGTVRVRPKGKGWQEVDLHPSVQEVVDVVNRILAPLNRRVNEAEPIVSGRLLRSERIPSGARVHVVAPPIAVSYGEKAYPAVNIRFFETEQVTGDTLVERWHSLSREMMDFLALAVMAHRNIMIAGRTGTGKTTMLNALSTFIPKGDRVLSIEDTAEVRFAVPNWVPLEARPPSLGGMYGVSSADLVNASLRMTPDWVIVGEIRSGQVAADLLQTQMSGHAGMSTIHARTPQETISTLVLRALQSGQFHTKEEALMLIGLALDVLVQTNFVTAPDDKGEKVHCRRVTHITEVIPDDVKGAVLRPLWEYDHDASTAENPVWRKVGEPSEALKDAMKWVSSG